MGGATCERKNLANANTDLASKEFEFEKGPV